MAFLSPEASKAVQNYLSFSGRTEKAAKKPMLEQLEKQRVFDDECKCIYTVCYFGF